MDLMKRAGDLKGELSEYAKSPRFQRATRNMILRAFPNGVDNEMIFSTALDAFVFTERLEGGQTVLGSFAERFTGADRALLLSWADYVQGVFEIKEPYGEDGVVAVNHVDELTYRIRSNIGAEGVEQLTPGVIMVGGIVPVGDDWMISGAATAYSAEDADMVLAGVRTLQLQNPKMVFRNPDKLAQARVIQAEQRASFIDLYGGDLVVVGGDAVKETMLAFYRHHHERGGGEAAEWQEPELPDLGFAGVSSVAIVFDADEGLSFFPSFDLAQAVFADPSLIVRRPYRDVVSGYLRGGDTGPGILRRLAATDPAKADEVFRRLLKKPGFSWDRDGEALLRKHKPTWFDGPVLPRMIPV
ncbi:hypothetical protein [Nonomuraea sp. SBT364]|uniref:hypothetical protein n=1 Tax=Nonomuraea sp. SBT364 TaxID=1580530 RepID=UPI00066E3035|nr:hypothetical protein [Nonomuraea sp. SBT364]